MATVKSVALLALVGCGQLQGFGGPTPPLATIDVEGTGSATGDLHIAMVWGAQWLTEPLCILPPENSDAATAIAQGCRDPFSFVPARVGADVPVTLGDAAPIELLDLPTADLMIGGVTARVAYASFVLYDDVNGNGALDFNAPQRLGGFEGDQPPPDTDVVVGASFVTMTSPDRRLAYREGDFDATAAFYPRAGCAAPPRGFSIVDAGGFSYADAIAAAEQGKLPQEDPTTCAEAATDQTTVQIAVAADPTTVSEVACDERRDDSSIRFREPPDTMPDFTGRALACVHLASFGAPPPQDVIQLIVSTPQGAACKGLTHYVLKGCREDATCSAPDWDHSAAPPTWWPC